MEQHGVDHAEDGGRGADAEGEGDDRNRGESRALAQHAEAETKILREILQPIHFAHIPAPFVCSRSEEHTSELQSQSNLVCRLLLEKKKNNRIQRNHAVIAAATKTTALRLPHITKLLHIDRNLNTLRSSEIIPWSRLHQHHFYRTDS